MKLNFRSIFALTIVCSVIVVTALLFFIKAPDQNRDILNIIVGGLIGALGSITKDFYSANDDNELKDLSMLEIKQAMVDKIKDNEGDV